MSVAILVDVVVVVDDDVIVARSCGHNKADENFEFSHFVVMPG
jgi:hypothetical protein